MSRLKVHSQIWISKLKGLPLRQEDDIGAGNSNNPQLRALRLRQHRAADLAGSGSTTLPRYPADLANFVADSDTKASQGELYTTSHDRLAVVQSRLRTGMEIHGEIIPRQRICRVAGCYSKLQSQFANC